MRKGLAWLKAHWAPVLGIGLAVIVAAWFFIFRKASAGTAAGVSSVTIPAAGAAGGSTGGGSTDTTIPAIPAVPALAAITDPATQLFNSWNNPNARADLRPNGRSFAQWVQDLLGQFSKETGQAVPGQQAGVGGLQTLPDVNALWAEYTQQLAAKVGGGVTTPAPPLGAPAGPAQRPEGWLRPRVSPGGGLGSGSSPSIAPNGPIVNLIPRPQSFSQPAVRRRIF